MFQPILRSLPTSAGVITGDVADNQLTLEVAELGRRSTSSWALHGGDAAELRVTPRVCSTSNDAEQCAAARAVAHWLFVNEPGIKSILFAPGQDLGLSERLLRSGVCTQARSDGARCRRAQFFQSRTAWLPGDHSGDHPLEYVMSQGKRHPLRPARPRGVCYERYVAQLGLIVSFRTISPERDLPAFNRWMNEPRVAAFWELPGTLERHREYLTQTLADPHMHPVVGCFGDEPFGYFELYWAKEDRIAPYYPVDDYDRGLHMLVGEAKHRGPEKVSAWLPSLAHYLFLDDARTRAVVAEPRSDNAKMIRYLERAGFHKTHEFDFPHKRSAMMVLSREAFFEQFCP